MKRFVHVLTISTLAASAPACGDDTSSGSVTDTFTETGVSTLTSESNTDSNSSESGDNSDTGDGDADSTGDGDSGDGDSGDGVSDDGDSGDGDSGDGDSGDGDSGDGDSGDGDGDGECTEFEILCDGTIAQECDGQGGFNWEMECAPQLCVPGIGCAECVPGESQCIDDGTQLCDPTGFWGPTLPCDELQGIICNDQTGECEGACENLGVSYIGCDYYPTITSNSLLLNQGTAFNFAVVIANTSATPANITVTLGATTVTTAIVPGNDATVVILPWINSLSQSTTSNLVVDGAYRLRSTQPVSVYQYNPLEYVVGTLFSFTNDASLLFPVTTWGTETVVVSSANWQFSTQNYGGLHTIVASEDGTTVTLTPSASVGTVSASSGVLADGSGTVSMNEGDVMQIFTTAGDSTGTRVNADKPIQVIGGHVCTNIPSTVTYCDHLEESIPPLTSVGKTYIASSTLITAGVPKNRMVRIVATEANTTLTYDPVQAQPTTLTNAGDWIEFQTGADFQVSSDNKILVAEYLTGQTLGGNSGDPAMSLAVPVEQYRNNYLIHAPTNYETNFANIIAPTGSSIQLDGNPVGGFNAIGGTGYSLAQTVLANTVDGNHTLTGDAAFGITVYGYGQYTSYYYPGGLDLNLVPE